jgi:hypothetical protein
MLPIALGIGSDSSFRGPMAIVVIGGLVTSTVLSLLVIPVVFTYVDDLLLWLKRLVARIHRTDVDPAAARQAPLQEALGDGVGSGNSFR